MPENTYQLSYTGQQVDEAIGKALTGLPTITIAVSQVISQDPLQIQLTNEQYATMNGHPVILDASALGMPVVIADYNGEYTDNNNNITYLSFIFIYGNGNFVEFNSVSVNVSTKVAEIKLGRTYPNEAYRADNARNADKAESVDYRTVAPTFAKTDGLEIVVLSSDPPRRYDGYLYIITGSN